MNLGSGLCDTLSGRREKLLVFSLCEMSIVGILGRNAAKVPYFATAITNEWSLVQMTAGFLLKTITDLDAFVT